MSNKEEKAKRVELAMRQVNDGLLTITEAAHKYKLKTQHLLAIKNGWR